MKSKPKRKGLLTKLKEAKRTRQSAKSSLEGSKGSAKLQILGARMKVNEIKNREKKSRLPGPSAELEQAMLNLERTKTRARGRDEEGMRMRRTIKENSRMSVIKRHLKGE